MAQTIQPVAAGARHESSGFIVLGMHRSGTSVLAQLLQVAGANPGERVIPGSRGNEEGHFEDAFAVETNDRLLAALGYRWDDVRPLPVDWQRSEAAAVARLEIRDYIRSNLIRHRLWLIKDPRMCLLADVWLGALADEGVTHSVLLMGRHPLEVARSLAVRNGMASGNAMVSWLRHVLAAERASRGVPRLFMTYDGLLANVGGTLDRIRELPGGEHLALELPAELLAGIVQPQRRHHQHANSTLPLVVERVWRAHVAAVEDPDTQLFDTAETALQHADALFAPVLQAIHSGQALLWERAARAEAAIADVAYRERLESHSTALADLCKAFVAFSEGNTRALSELLVIVGQELPRLNNALTLSREEVGALGQERRTLLADARRLNSRLETLQYDSELLQKLSQSLSWRITRPMRVLRRLLFDRGERQKFGHWWSGKVAGLPFVPASHRSRTSMQMAVEAAAPPVGADPADVPAQILSAGSMATRVPLSAAIADRPDVFVWAVIDWHFRMQRPQHLAKALAVAGHRVFYVSNNMVDSTRDGFAIEPLDGDGRLFQVRLNVEGAPAIYHGAPDESTIARLRASVGELMQWSDSIGGLCIVQHPYWLDVAASVSGSALLYDCMDHHAGFENNAPEVIAAEHRLITLSDLLIVTSAWLDEALAPANANRALIRNATEYAHFSQRPKHVYKDGRGRRIIGYYGAIAEWFDVELVKAVAQRFPDCCVLLVGSDTTSAAERLRGVDNVIFTGEVPYGDLPYYLYAFDVALLPFRVIELTLATNPVKVYEYLSAGRPVVSVDLPEIVQFGDLVYRAATREGFLDAVTSAMAEAGEDAMVGARRQFAAAQTWDRRALELDAAIAELPAPRVSVVVLTYNNIEFTKACLRSIESESNWPQLEIIVVDNASSDGTREYLSQWAQAHDHRKVILNERNLGFAAGNNIGLAAATGEYLVLLNNDTYVTPNWVRTLVNHLRRNPRIGIIGPVTNNIGNEAKIEIRYDSMDGMRSAAAAYTRRHLGELIPIRTVAFFCVAMPRATYEMVGSLDEVFGVGFFEDDDYCRRVEAAGLDVACAEDVFVHHHLSASFDKLKAETREQLFLRNKALYEAKWGEWTAHAYRQPPNPSQGGCEFEETKPGSGNR